MRHLIGTVETMNQDTSISPRRDPGIDEPEAPSVMTPRRAAGTPPPAQREPATETPTASTTTPAKTGRAPVAARLPAYLLIAALAVLAAWIAFMAMTGTIDTLSVTPQAGEQV